MLPFLGKTDGIQISVNGKVYTWTENRWVKSESDYDCGYSDGYDEGYRVCQSKTDIPDWKPSLYPETKDSNVEAFSFGTINDHKKTAEKLEQVEKMKSRFKIGEQVLARYSDRFDQDGQFIFALGSPIQYRVATITSKNTSRNEYLVSFHNVKKEQLFTDTGHHLLKWETR